MGLDKDDMVAVTITLTREYRWTGTAAEFATAAGLTHEQVRDVIDGYETDGFDWEPTEETLATMADQPDTEVDSEEWDWSEAWQA